tara:strand:+ start:7292 stop:7501 length:210 start_codon:yes stop_codon:yes gene_type:complete
MSTLVKVLKKQGTVRGRRWIVKRNSNNIITEVKCIFKPEEYKIQKGARPMVGDKKLIEILENEKEKNKS